MTEPRPGMDHDLYPYSAINRRPAISWPDGNGLAFTVLLHLEFWRLDPPKEDWRDPRYQGAFGNFYPDYTGYTQREYGNRIGIFRVLDRLDRFGLKLTVPANAAALKRYPAIVERLIDRKVEFVAAGTHADRMITSKLDADTQRWMIDESVATVERITGRRPTGWAGPAYGESEITAGLLAEFGLDYVMDWPNDDQPYMLTTKPSLVSIPRQPEWDDGEIMWLRKVPRETWEEMVVSAFDRLYEERAAGRYFSLSLHPWIVGQFHRIRFLEQVLERIAPPRDGVWQTTAGAVARHFRSLTSD